MGSKTILLLLGFFALVALVMPTDVYAIHQSDEMSWKLIMVSSYPACSNYHYQMTNQYQDVTEKYLALYQLDNEAYKPECIAEEKFEDYEFPEELDLIILVYDRNKGRDDLHTQNIGGFYSHFGDEWTHNHTIVFCDCSNFKYSDPTWILSHELSHFVLYYLGFDRTIVEDMVHKQDAQSDFCVEVEYLESCKEARMKMHTSNHDVTVMAPYEPAIGKKIMKEAENMDFDISPYRMNMQMEITAWWTDGKINDSDYVKSLELLLQKEAKREAVKEPFYSMESPNVIFTDAPKNEKLEESAHSAISLESEETRAVMNMLPYEEEYKQDMIKDDEEQDLPLWFKNRAVWWISGKIDNQEYLTGMSYYLTR